MIGSRLPNQPEPVEKLRARWPEALRFTVDAGKIKENPDKAYIPSQHRRHVFDFDGGLRIIVSRDICNDDEMLHVSASATKEWADQWPTLRDVLMRITDAIQSIGGKDVERAPDHEVFRDSGIIDFLWDL